MNLLLETLQFVQNNGDRVIDAGIRHVNLSFSALLLASLFAIPAGIWLALSGRYTLLVINIANVGRTVPSLAILALAMPLLGTGFTPSLLALALLAVPPILINTYVGFNGVDADTIDAARGVGMRESQITRQVRLPLALPMVFAGLRTAAVQVISGAVLAAYIGGGGFGEFITSGVAMMAMPMLLVGAVPATILAIAVDALFGVLQKAMTPKGIRTS
ncbi:MAG: ABC transporter permease [Alcaligenaceae bacterium]|nr:ABC transporter permease [Alcaligenaceae bacterium]